MKDLIFAQVIRILNKEIETTPIRFNYHEFIISEHSKSRSIYIRINEDDSIKISLDKRHTEAMKLTVTGISYNEYSFLPSDEEITELNYVLDKVRKLAHDSLLLELNAV